MKIIKKIIALIRYICLNKPGELCPLDLKRDKHDKPYVETKNKIIKINSHYVGEKPLKEKIIGLVKRKASE